MSARDGDDGDDDDMQLRGRNRVNKKNARRVWKISDQNMNKWMMKKKNGTHSKRHNGFDCQDLFEKLNTKNYSYYPI